MELANFKLTQVKKSRYDTVAEIAYKLNKPIGQMLKKFEGWDWKDIELLYISAKKTEGIPFSQAFWWQYNKIMEIDELK